MRDDKSIIKSKVKNRKKASISFKVLGIFFLVAIVFLSPLYLLCLFPGRWGYDGFYLYKSTLILYTLVVPVWFIIAGVKAVFMLFLKKKVGNGFRISFVLLTALLTSLFISSQVSSGLPSGSFYMKFDSDRWTDSTASEFIGRKRARQMMLGDLIKNVLPGKCKDEIIRALGPSLETPYFQSMDKDLIYYLGPQRDRLLNIDSEWLLIWLDENGCYERFMIVND